MDSKNSKHNWWDEPTTTTDHLSEIFPREDEAVVLKALRDRTCMVSGNVRGRAKYDSEKALDRFRAMGIIPYAKYEHCIRIAGPGEIVSIAHLGDIHTIDWVASCEEKGKEIHDRLEAWLEPMPPAKVDPPVYGFSYEHGSYVVREIGNLNDTFCEGNYDPEVVRSYGRIVTELQKDEPAGRLVLIEGNPGTGKTRLVRSLIGALVDSSKCIVVPPSLMDRLSGPEFTMCLIHQRMAGKPLTLILEDADDCLIAREKNEAAKASLSALLNLSDGIMGATLNLRVVATTNQELRDIDKAILRPGRLLERVHVGPLTSTQASAVYHRETGGDTKTYYDMTILAQVYEDVRNRRA